MIIPLIRFPNIKINSQYQKLAHTFPVVSLGTEFIKICPADETGQFSKGRGLETPPCIQTLPSLKLWADFMTKCQLVCIFLIPKPQF